LSSEENAVNKRKICVVAQEPAKTIRLHQTVQTLRKFGYEVEVLMPRFSVRFKPRLLSGVIRYLGIMFQVLCARADVYYVFNNPDIGLPVLLKRSKFVYDVRNPWGAEVYDLTGQAFAADLAEGIERVMTRNADVIVAVNERLAERARKWGAKNVFVVPNYPSSSFKPTLSRERVREKYDLEGKKVVLFTGNFADVECALDIARLFPKVLEEIPDAVLIMIGDGPQKSLIEKHIKENGLERNIRLYRRISREEVPNWLVAADVVVVPRKVNMRSSVYYYPEGIWKVTEALWMGKPIVAGAVGGFVGTKLPIETAPLEKFHEAIIEILEKPRQVKPLKKISWDYCEEQLKKVSEIL
jgi:glycosyltransferase involved in cell wall biosynthesis